MVSRVRPAPFRGRHFADVIIILCVRWYLRYSLSYLWRRSWRSAACPWITSPSGAGSNKYAPLLNQRLRRELRRPNGSWRVDETYIKVAGKWTYLYRAVDSSGDTIDFML